MKKKKVLITIFGVITAGLVSLKAFEEFKKARHEANESRCKDEIAAVQTDIDVLIAKIGDQVKENEEFNQNLDKCEKEATLCDANYMECDQKFADYHDRGECRDYMKLPPDFKASLDVFIKDYGQGILSESCLIQIKAKTEYKQSLDNKLARLKSKNKEISLNECERNWTDCKTKLQQCRKDYSAACFSSKEAGMDPYMHNH